MKDLSESLEIIEVGGTALCRRDIAVSKSEKIFEYVLKKQKKQELFRKNYWQLSQTELNQGETKEFVAL